MDEALGRSRRRLEYSSWDEFALPGAVEVRAAAKRWAETKGISIGFFSTPSETPDDKQVATARCGECTGCWQGKGTMYRCIVDVQAQITQVVVSQAAECTGEARVARAARVHKEDGILRFEFLF